MDLLAILVAVLILMLILVVYMSCEIYDIKAMMKVSNEKLKKIEKRIKRNPTKTSENGSTPN